jgi:hypothetical protein
MRSACADKPLIVWMLTCADVVAKKQHVLVAFHQAPAQPALGL